MRRELRWATSAERDLEKINRHSPQVARRVFQATAQYAETGRGDVVKLAGPDDLYRLRVGDWRVIFSYEDGDLVVLALRVLNRRDAYR